MTPRIIIPVRPPEEGKTRLAAALAPAARTKLNQRLFAHVLAVATRAMPAGACHVVSRSPAVLEAARAAGAQPIVELGDDLNAALTQASAVVAARSPAPVLTLSSDLPFVTVEDIVAMVAAGDSADVVIACDTVGQGTNALLLRRPGLIPYLYGADSAVAHRRAAEAAGLAVAIVQRPGLGEDIDTPAQLAAMGQQLE